MNIKIFFYLFTVSLFPFGLVAQSKTSVDYNVLLEQLEESLSKGEKRSLRDLGSLLDKQSTKKEALDLLRRFTLFNKEEINLDRSISKKEFHRFYYDFEGQIQFSDLLSVYLIVPLESRKIKYEVQAFNNLDDRNSKTIISAIKSRSQQAIADKNQGVLLQQLQALGDFQNEDSNTLLLDLSRKLRQSSKKWSGELYRILGQQLARTRNLECLKELLNLVAEKKIDPATASSQLLVLTNIGMKTEPTSRTILKTYRHYIDSLGTIEAMRTHGYQQVFNFRPSFFNQIVDYYGRILCFAGNREWLIYNATQDLIATQHSRSLFYLAGLGYKNTEVLQTDQTAMLTIIKTISELSQIKVGVENVKGSIDFNVGTDKDKKLLKNYLTYWAAHYSDYEWDAIRNCYVNKYNALEKTQSYEKLFRRLNSRNDSVAMVSFAQLTEGEPTEIVVLAEKYRQMFRSYNQSLPPFKYKYLEQLSTLTYFCKEQNLPYKPNKKLSQLLGKLLRETHEIRRYQLENKIIQSLQISDITAVEYWGCINQSSEVTNYSLGRILDVFYSKNWTEIVDNDQQLRLYLKKSKLLSNIGVIGVCNNYLNKFDLDKPQTKKRLLAIRNVETDRHILSQIAVLIANNKGETSSALSDFIDFPLRFNKRDIKGLPAPGKKEVGMVIQKIAATDDKNEIKKLFYYLRLKPTLEQAPTLFKLATDERVLLKRRGWEMTVADHVTPILENIFNYNFKSKTKEKQFDIQPWLALWKEDKANYEQWPNRFFDQKIKQLSSSKTLSIDDINLITESPNFEEKHKYVCLEALQKVKPQKDIRSLNIDPKLSLKDDLKYFQSFDFSYKVLDDIPKLFEIEDPATMLNYLIEKADKFKISEKGSLINNLFRYPWFSSYLHSGQVSNQSVAYLEKTLKSYLSEAGYLSEFEEQTTTLHLSQLQSIGMPLKDRLLASIKLDVDDKSKAKIQETIISTISYEEIGLVAQHFNELTVTDNKKPWDFLRKDFGLPIFDLKDNALIDFLNHHTTTSEYDFYIHYLKEFGVDFLAKKEKLDYQKIYDILQFDAVTPFVAGSGGKRDYYTYGVIKLLELHFETTLDFHRKLNENQSFYSFSTAKRSEAWITYLIEHKLIKVDDSIAPSFTMLLEEILREDEATKED